MGIEKGMLFILRANGDIPDPKTSGYREEMRNCINSQHGSLLTLETPQGEYQGIFQMEVTKAYFYRRHGEGTVYSLYRLEDLKSEGEHRFSTQVSPACIPCEGWKDLSARLRICMAEIREK